MTWAWLRIVGAGTAKSNAKGKAWLALNQNPQSQLKRRMTNI
jgi:hypothetical protein